MENLTDEEELLKEALEEQMAQEYFQEDVKQEAMLPSRLDKDSQYKFMRELLDTLDSTKVANLSPEEIGTQNLSVRGCMNVSLIADQLGLEEFKKYYIKKAEIINATSMSKKGKFLELVFTQIRKHISGSDQPRTKKGIFSWGKKDETV